MSHGYVLVSWQGSGRCRWPETVTGEVRPPQSGDGIGSALRTWALATLRETRATENGEYSAFIVEVDQESAFDPRHLEHDPYCAEHIEDIVWFHEAEYVRACT